jgi:hypothetical protein
MKYVARKDEKIMKFELLKLEYEKEVKILKIIEKKKIDDIIAKDIYYDD